MDDVYSFLKQNIHKDKMIVGVSGGVDSMVLLSILNGLFPKQVICAHVHHNLRKESDEEQEFVRDYCAKNDIIFEFKKLEYESKFSEEIARQMRYNFYEELIEKYQANILLTAHHGDDLIETVIMKIVRGSTIKGYSGIELISQRDKYRIMRPLLYLSKEDIYRYAKAKEIPYREDITNKSDAYTRNRNRKNLLPFLKMEQKKVHLKFLEYSETLLSYYEYVEKVIDDLYHKIVIDNKLYLEKLNELDPFIRDELIKKYLFTIYGNKINKINKKHLKIILNFINNAITNTSINLPYNYRLIKTYNYIIIVKEEKFKNFELLLEDKLSLPNGKVIEIVNNCDDNSNFTTHLDLSNIILPLKVRNYLPGDKMVVKNMKGHKKISDIFTDEKIGLDERKSWPVVVDQENKIIWLPGLKKTYFDRKNTEKYDIILKYY